MIYNTTHWGRGRGGGGKRGERSWGIFYLFYFYRGSRRVFVDFWRKRWSSFLPFFPLTLIPGIHKQFPCNLQVMTFVYTAMTVIITNSSIQCLGCEVSTLFSGEKDNDRLRMLNTTGQRLTKLKRQNCSVNLNNSWYIGCYGEKVPLRENIRLFHLEWRKRKNKDNYAYFFKVRKL